jgi:hypothetical protein
LQNQEVERVAATLGSDYDPKCDLIELRQGGPATKVKWSFPLLPGVLVTDSWYSIGPLWAEGGVKLVFYYGIDSVELTLFGWIT